MATRKNFPTRIDQRRKDAADRQAAYDSLTKDEKIARARERGGKNELAKLEVS